MKDAAEEKKSEKPKRGALKKLAVKAETEEKKPDKSRSRPKVPKNSAPPKHEDSASKKVKEVFKERNSSKARSSSKAK